MNFFSRPHAYTMGRRFLQPNSIAMHTNTFLCFRHFLLLCQVLTQLSRAPMMTFFLISSHSPQSMKLSVASLNSIVFSSHPTMVKNLRLTTLKNRLLIRFSHIRNVNIFKLNNLWMNTIQCHRKC